MPLRKWGGVSLVLCSLYSKQSSFASCLHPAAPSPFPSSIVANFQSNRAKQGKNEFLFGGRWCFLGVLGDNKVQNTNIFLKVRKENRCGGGRLPAFWRAHWSRGCRLQDLPDAGSGPLVVRSLPFVRFPALLAVHLLEIWLYLAFNGFLTGFLLVDVCLYCFGALR